MHYYRFNIGDYASHTAHLDPLEDIAYRRMLDYCYLHETGLPESVQDIARVIRMRDEYERIANVIREFFYLHDDGTYRHTRVDRDTAEYHAKSDKARESVNKRWEKQRVSEDTNVLRPQYECNTNHKPITNNHKPLENAPPDGVSEKREKSNRGSRLPADWQPDLEWTREQGLQSPDLELAKFRDYWNGLSGQKGVKADWDATWRNWVRRAIERQPTLVTRPSNTPDISALLSAKHRGASR